MNQQDFNSLNNKLESQSSLQTYIKYHQMTGCLSVRSPCPATHNFADFSVDDTSYTSWRSLYPKLSPVAVWSDHALCACASDSYRQSGCCVLSHGRAVLSCVRLRDTARTLHFYSFLKFRRKKGTKHKPQI